MTSLFRGVMAKAIALTYAVLRVHPLFSAVVEGREKPILVSMALWNHTDPSRTRL